MRKTTGFIILMAVCAYGLPALSQSIYSGGKGDGFSLASVAQPDNILFNIYSGGKADGFSFASVAQPDNVLFNIYSGGNADGFSLNSVAQPDNVLYSIYAGGNADGFSLGSVAQPDNVLYSIYAGGTADGFSLSSVTQPDNVLYNIYNGGIADGFAFGSLGSIGGEVPLPIELLSFTGNYQNRIVHLQWKTASETNNDYFLLEKSQNGIDFFILYKLNGAGTTSSLKTYSFNDENPFSGLNYYRLQQVDFDLRSTYSEVISIVAEKAQMLSMLVSPNPSESGKPVSLFINGVDEGTPADLQITTTMGQSVAAFSTVVDKSNQIKISSSMMNELASGVYVVTLSIANLHMATKLVVK